MDPIKIKTAREQQVPATIIICAGKLKTTVVKLKPSQNVTLKTSYEARADRQIRQQEINERQKRNSLTNPKTEKVSVKNNVSGSVIHVQHFALGDGDPVDQKRNSLITGISKAVKDPAVTEKNDSLITGTIRNSEKKPEDPIKWTFRTFRVNNDFTCPECPDLKFHNKPDWRIHMNRHKFKCKYCEKSFTRQSDYDPHIRRHLGITPFVCDICGKRFHNQRYIKTHLKTHSDKRDFICSVCGEMFKFQAALNIHMKKHDGKWLQCDHCEKKFLHKCSLDVHVRLHTGERPYKCAKCDKSFPSKSKLSEHVKHVHDKRKNIVCDICGASFVKQSNYKVHYRVHTGEKPCFCNLCGKNFRSTSILLGHKKAIHSGVKAFQCDFCERGFQRKHRKREHEEKYHKDELIQK